jgi:hypothetical protein
MSVRVRPYRRGGWEVDVRVRMGRRNRAARSEACAGVVAISGDSMGRGTRTGTPDSRPTTTQEGGSDTQRILAASRVVRVSEYTIATGRRLAVKAHALPSWCFATRVSRSPVSPM